LDLLVVKQNNKPKGLICYNLAFLSGQSGFITKNIKHQTIKIMGAASLINHGGSQLD
jgi:hypothetical protein